MEKWPDRMTQGTKNTAKPLRLPPGESIRARRCDPAGKNKKRKKYGYRVLSEKIPRRRSQNSRRRGSVIVQNRYFKARLNPQNWISSVFNS